MIGDIVHESTSQVKGSEQEELPQRHGRCNCSCHAWPGVKHVAPCCTPDIYRLNADRM